MSNDEWSIEVEGKYHSHDVVFLYRTLVQKYPSFLCGMTNFRTFLQIGPGMWFLNNSAKTSSPLVWNIIFGHSKKDTFRTNISQFTFQGKWLLLWYL